MINIELLDKIEALFSTASRKDFNASNNYTGLLEFSYVTDDVTVRLSISIPDQLYTFMIISSNQYTHMSPSDSRIVISNYHNVVSFDMDKIESNDDIFNMSLIEDIQGMTIEVLNKIKHLQDKTIKIIEDIK